jgi:beta-1,4-mannosyltransferase
MTGGEGGDDGGARPRASSGGTDAGALAGARVAVIVLGDLGRSPRMQNHALALAAEGAAVDLIGYRGRPVDRALAEHPRIRVRLLPEPLRQRVPRSLFVPAALADLAAQTVRLAVLLLRSGSPSGHPLDLLLVQNPPAFPTLLVAALMARASRCRVVIDWHNFGADLLGLKLGAGSPLVTAARAAERALGRRADAHLCVSAVMGQILARDWGIGGAQVLRDRPAQPLGRLPPDARQELYDRLQLPVRAADASRPAVIVTSSSWTADDDVSVLLDAMRACDTGLARETSPLPALLFVMTGEGPLRATWERRIEALGLTRVRTRTLWVEPADYPRLLGAADLGVCVHRSASGADLPMKIADMFGAGLPVCALDYGPVLEELVRDGVNGKLFSTADELAGCLRVLLDGFPTGADALDRLRRGVERTSAETWMQGWRREALPLFTALAGRAPRGDGATAAGPTIARGRC